MKFVSSAVLAAVLLLTIASCVKQDYKAPPERVIPVWDTSIPIGTTLKYITASCLSLSQEVGYRKLGDTIIYGIVVADDKSGNLYKNIIIQDTSGGAIDLYLDKSYLYNDYPVGRKVYIKLKNLYLVNYKGLPEICYSAAPDGTGEVATGAIPGALLDSFIIKGSIQDTSIKAKVLTINEVSSNVKKYMCNLVTINDVQFDGTSQNKVYADFEKGTNRIVQNCAGSSIILRTSGYSDFQPILTPTGKGTITAVVTAFFNTPQLLIRDTTDVKFYGPRCP